MRYLVISLLLVCSFSLLGQEKSEPVHELIVTQYGYEAGLLSQDITALFQDSRGIFWVGTRDAGVLQFNEGRFVTIPEISQEIGRGVTGLCEDSRGTLVVETDHGVFLYDGRLTGLADKAERECTRSILPSADNGEIVLCQQEMAIGHKWLGTDSGLRSFNPVDAVWQFYGDALGLLNDPIQAIMYDHNDVLWIGTRTNGLLQYIGPVNETPDIILPSTAQIARYHPAEGNVTVMCSNGEVYALNQSDGLMNIPALDSIRIENYFVDRQGYLWLEMSDGWAEDSRTASDIRIVRAALPDSVVSTVHLKHRINAFAYDRLNTIWIETKGNKLFRAEALPGEGQYQLIQSNASLPGDRIVSLMAETGSAAHPGENLVYRVGAASVGIVHQGRYENLYTAESEVRCGHVEESGVMWIGTEDGGIMKIENGKPPIKLELPTPWGRLNLSFLHKEGAVLWVGTDRAVYQLSLDETQRIVLRGTRILSLQGMSQKKLSFTAMGDEAICVIADKAVYFLQTQGFTPQSNTPRVYLSDVNLRDNALSESKYSSTTGAYAQQVKRLSLGYRENTLTLSWQGLNSVPGSLTYSYRLGPGEAWSTPSARTALQLAGLAPGTYLFDVQVCDAKGNCDTLKSPWQFEIRKALWQNWWFWVIVGVLAILGMVSGIKYREREIKKKALRDLQVVKSKLYTLELEQKAMQLQMNPHFIFNAIQTIHHQLLNNKVNKAANSLVSFSTLMRSMLEMSRAEKVSLEDEFEFLQAYVRVERICRSEPIEFDINIGEKIELFDTMIPSMMLQPIIENAIKHGGPRIALHVKYKGKYLLFKITDDGPGFPEELFEKDKSVALKLLKERVEHMPGNGFVKYYNVMDIGVVKGACVELSVLESDR